MKLLPQLEDKQPDEIEKLAQQTAQKAIAQQSGARIQAERAAIRSILERYLPAHDGEER